MKKIINQKNKEKFFEYLIIPNLIIYAFFAAFFLKGGTSFADKTTVIEVKNSNTQANVAMASPKPAGQTEIIDKPKGNNFPWGQCTWYVATKRNVTWNGNAISWYANAKAAGRKVGQKPIKGSIVVLNQGYYGHVGYVESINGNLFTFSESNNPIPGRVSRKIMNTSDSSIIGFIY